MNENVPRPRERERVAGGRVRVVGPKATASRRRSRKAGAIRFPMSDFGFTKPGMSANAFGSDPDASGLEAGTFRRGVLPFRNPLNKNRRFLPRGSTMFPARPICRYPSSNYVNRRASFSAPLPRRDGVQHLHGFGDLHVQGQGQGWGWLFASVWDGLASGFQRVMITALWPASSVKSTYSPFLRR